MSYISEINDLKGRSILSVLTLLMLITPGIAVIYYYHRHLISEIDIFKLLLLSITFILPAVLLPFIPILLWLFNEEELERTRSKTKQDNDLAILLALFIDLLLTNFLIYSGLIVASIKHIKFKNYIYIELSLGVLMFTIFLVASIVQERELKKLKVT